MTRHAPLWQQGQEYPAQLDRQLLVALLGGGGGSGAPPAVVADTMNVSIPPGWLAVPMQPGQGSAVCYWDAPELVTIDAAPPSGQSRYDYVICQVRDPAVDGGPNSDFVFTTAKGVAATSGTQDEPAIPANAVPIMLMGVIGGTANLNDWDHKDRRPLGHAEVHLANNQALPNSSSDKLRFDIVDGGAGFDADHSYLCPMPGRYLVTASMLLDKLGAACSQASVYKNGVWQWAGDMGGGNAYFGNCSVVSAVVAAAAGDRLAVHGFVGGVGFSAQGAGYTQAAFTYLGSADIVPAALSRPAPPEWPPPGVKVPEL